jgi:hypothetical protein
MTLRGPSQLTEYDADNTVRPASGIAGTVPVPEPSGGAGGESGGAWAQAPRTALGPAQRTAMIARWSP